MAEPIVSLALETIRDLLVEEAKFVYGVKDELIELQTELVLLNSYLKDADARSHEEDRVHAWLQQAKRVSYRAEDVIEAYAYKVSSRKGRRSFKQKARRVACILGECATLHNVGSEILKIKNEIVNLTASLQTYGINQIIQTPPTAEEIENRRRLRMTYGHEVQQYFVGMEDDLSKLVTWSVEDTMIRRVITICGIGGLGKTTLAKQVYNHPQLKQWFDVLAWVCITQECQPKTILKDILTQFLGNAGDMEESDLVRKLYEFQKEKKCLVVLDDMWKLDDWEILKHAFPVTDSSSKSKILITTRIEEVAEVADHSSQHKPSCLNQEDGFKLLKFTAFQDEQDRTIPLSVEQIGREMVEKCGGLPLAISAIGGILRNKNPDEIETEWESVNKDIDKHLRKKKGVLSILALSYDDLPFYLKPCFLYLCLFSEDESIDTKEIYHLWMAEGFVSLRGRQHDESFMDVAQEYLKELASRNMVQVHVPSYTRCKLHDLMRELCLAKAKEELFFEVIRRSPSNTEVVSSSSGEKDSCRLAILLGDHVDKVLDLEQISNRYLRALHVSPYSQIIGRSKKIKMLRSLILDGCRFEDKKLPREIGDMIHLRLLSLNRCDLDELPSFVGNLTNLQILRAHFDGRCHDTNIFKKMKKLRYLQLPYLSFGSSTKRIELNGLNELEYIHGFDSTYYQHTDLSMLVNIRDFSRCLYGCEVLSTFLVQITNCRKLRFRDINVELELDETYFEKNYSSAKDLFMCSFECKLVLKGPIGKLPRYEAQLCRNFIRIELVGSLIEEDPMQFLKELPNLIDLELDRNSFVGKEMSCDSKSFPKLKYIWISGLPNIEIWKLDKGAMPNLSHIEIDGCNMFEIVADGFNNLTSLEQISIFRMPDEFEKKYGELPSKKHHSEY